MAQKGIRPNGETYQLIIQFFTAGKNVELALQFLHEMKLAGFEAITANSSGYRQSS